MYSCTASHTVALYNSRPMLRSKITLIHLALYELFCYGKDLSLFGVL